MSDLNNSYPAPVGGVPLPDANNWESIRRWRAACRALLIKARIGIGKAGRRHCQQEIQSSVMKILTDMVPGIIGFYWPIKGEFDMRGLVTDLIGQGWQAALPVVVKAATPLEFYQWTPDTKLVPGVWNIPVPQVPCSVTPTVLLIPLVGFDKDNFRLGHGGGYYDRSLAAFHQRPLTIGIGLENSRLDTIYPQWHDIAMDSIVTACVDADTSKIEC